MASIAWSATAEAGCTTPASISSTISAIDPQGVSHVIAQGSCAGCTTLSTTSTGYTCVQDAQAGVNCSGDWQLNEAVTFQLPAGGTFDSGFGGCTPAGSTLSCSQTVPAGTAALFLPPPCPATSAATTLARTDAFSQIDSSSADDPLACFDLIEGKYYPELNARIIRNIRDSHFPGGKNVDSSKGLFYKTVTDGELANIVAAGMLDKTNSWVRNSTGYYQKAFSYSEDIGTRSETSGGGDTNGIVLIVSAKTPSNMLIDVVNMYPA